MEQAQRPHATRKLRNKAVAGARQSARGLLNDDDGDGGKSGSGGDGGAGGSGSGGASGSAAAGGSVTPFFPSSSHGGGNGGYFGIGTAANGLGSLLQNMGFSTADVLALTAAGRLGFHFGAPAKKEQARKAKESQTGAEEETDADKTATAIASSSKIPDAPASSSSTRQATRGLKRKAKDNITSPPGESSLPVDVMEAIAVQEASRASEDGVFAGLDSGVAGLHLLPASFLDALGLGGPGSGFGAGGLSGLLEGTGAHAPSIIVGPGGTSSAKNKKKKGGAALASAAAAAAGNDDAGDGDGAGGGLGLSGAGGSGGAGGSQLDGSGAGGGAGGSGTGGSGANAGGAPATTAAGLVAASIAAGPGGRLRWDVGKSLLSLTSAKTIEIEGDLINLRKIGSKRRRR